MYNQNNMQELKKLCCDDFSVDKIKDPLILASSLISVWRLGHILPWYRWRTGLQFTQTLLPASQKLEYRVERLVNYRRPWFKFLVGRVARWVFLALVIFTVGFLWRFHSKYGHLDVGFGDAPGIHICGDHCTH